MTRNKSAVVRSQNAMKTLFIAGAFTAAILGSSGCSDREANAQKAREESAAKARADAAKKEMDTVAKTFQTPDYFKKNDPQQKPASGSETLPKKP